ncbi:Cytochrome c assembly protein [mine drainage metagenome]|uniref:Cytochrome c assembly protein n=1 Tax=mine drainage metagenome TaxID=410659 RepID=T1CY11_9ZZZZ
MNGWLITSSVAVAYCAAAWLIYQAPRTQHANQMLQRLALALAFVALVGQADLVAQALLLPKQGLNLAFSTDISLVGFMISLVVFGGSWFEPVVSAGIVVFPLAALSALFAQLFPGEVFLLSTRHLLLDAHVLISLLAYSMMGVASVLAILLWVRESGVRRAEGSRPGFLPPLLVLERLLFQYLVVGFALLTLALISGFAYIRMLWLMGLWPKAALGVLAWILFGWLLWGRRRYGWRGRAAAGWTLAAFAALALSYFGTQLFWQLEYPSGHPFLPVLTRPLKPARGQTGPVHPTPSRN